MRAIGRGRRQRLMEPGAILSIASARRAERTLIMVKLLHASTLLAGLLVSALATPALAAGQQVVNAELWNKPDGSQGITLSTDHVKPGVILFKVKNISTDEDHELLLAKA